MTDFDPDEIFYFVDGVVKITNEQGFKNLLVNYNVVSVEPEFAGHDLHILEPK